MMRSGVRVEKGAQPFAQPFHATSLGPYPTLGPSIRLTAVRRSDGYGVVEAFFGIEWWMERFSLLPGKKIDGCGRWLDAVFPVALRNSL